MNARWCYTTFPLLKWLEIIFSIIVIGLVQTNVTHWSGYAYILFVALSAVLGCLLLLLIYCTNVYTKTANYVPWVGVEIFFNFLASVLFLVAFALAVYDAVTMMHGTSTHHASTINSSEWRNRMAAVSAFCGANAILFFFGGVQVKRKGIA